jgi:hypothetical protein
MTEQQDKACAIYQVRSKEGKHWSEVSKPRFDFYQDSPEIGVEVRILYTAPPSVEALTKEVERLRAQFVSELASIEAGANKIIDERIATLEATNAAQAERIGELEGFKDEHLDLLSDVLEAKEVMRAAGIEQDCFAKMFAAYSALLHSSSPAESQLAGGEAVGELWSGLNDCARELGYDFLRPEFAHASRALVKYAPNNLGVHTAAPAIKQQVAEHRCPEHCMRIPEHCQECTPTHPVSANQPDSGKVPPGYALVPIMPTASMHGAGDGAAGKCWVGGKVWAAMLAASPSAPIAEQVRQLPPCLPPKYLSWALDDETAKFLADLINGNDEPTPITLSVGFCQDDDGKVEYGLRVHETEYPEEGASMLVEMEFPAAPVDSVEEGKL